MKGAANLHEPAIDTSCKIVISENKLIKLKINIMILKYRFNLLNVQFKYFQDVVLLLHAVKLLTDPHTCLYSYTAHVHIYVQYEKTASCEKLIWNFSHT